MAARLYYNCLFPSFMKEFGQMWFRIFYFLFSMCFFYLMTSLVLNAFIWKLVHSCFVLAHIPLIYPSSLESHLHHLIRGASRLDDGTGFWKMGFWNSPYFWGGPTTSKNLGFHKNWPRGKISSIFLDFGIVSLLCLSPMFPLPFFTLFLDNLCDWGY